MNKIEDALLSLADQIQEEYRYQNGPRYAARIRAEVKRIEASRAAIVERCAKVADKKGGGWPWTAGSDCEVIARQIRELLW